MAYTDDKDVTRLEVQYGKPVSIIVKHGKTVLVIGRGMFKKKIVIPRPK